jgi:undecaprenyl-diphosphatase
MVSDADVNSHRERWLPRIQAAELLIVRRCASPNSVARILAVFGSKLGNGWAYPLLVSALIWVGGPSAWTAVLVGGVSAAALHCIYPVIKAWAARPRPFDADPNLRSLLQPLDLHSFPSGHVMTLTAVAVPIVVSFPASIVPLSGLWFLVSWSRVVCAHHYPTDVLAGTLLGFSVATPLALWWAK